MDWLDKMNGAINYIEENLKETIYFEEAAKRACTSVYHFQRLFSFITDIPLSEYIRRRRLTLAAFELQNSDIKVLDLSLKYGYDSPVSFTRAFQNQHGITPSLARDKGVELKAYPRISFQITIKGDVAMEYKIVEKEAFEVYGIERIFSMANDDNLREIPEFWRMALEDGQVDKLANIVGKNNEDGLCPVNAICCYKSTGDRTFPYMLFAVKNERSKTDGYTVAEVPASTWAIFKSREYTQDEVTSVIQDLNRRVYTEWIPTADYDRLDGYELEMYYENPVTGKCYCETWIRVTPRA